MPHLSQLLDSLPANDDLHMSANGYVLWVCWHGELPSSINLTLQNFGGMFITGGMNQSLWYFFSTDIFMALARLSVWGSFNELPVTMELFTGSLQLSTKKQINLGVSSVLRAQEILPGTGLKIWIHPQSISKDRDFPGVTLEPAAAPQGMSPADWHLLSADPHLPYESIQGWYAILHPLGNPLDKQFQAGWQSMFERFEAVHQELKLKILIHHTFLCLSLDNLAQLRSWLGGILLANQNTKINEHDAYWPCVAAIIDRKSISFNSDLPMRVGLQWDRLMPDFPYISYRNAYLLGNEFSIQDLRFSSEHANMDSWCNIGLGEKSSTTQAIPLLMPSQLLSGEHPACFFCGIPSHAHADCPTHALRQVDPDALENITPLGLDELNTAFRSIEVTLAKEGSEGYSSILQGRDSNAALLLQNIFSLNSIFQLRQCYRQWLFLLKEFQRNPTDMPVKQDDSPVWALLEALEKAGKDDLGSLERQTREQIEKNPRDGRLCTLLGFILIFRNDISHAVAAFHRASSTTSAPQLQAWNDLLAARALETEGHLPDALEEYAKVQRLAPYWQENRYRILICKVKMGFTDHILGEFLQLIQDNPIFFNHIIIDHEAGPGRLVILTALYNEWKRIEDLASAEKQHLHSLEHQIREWFDPDHPVGTYLMRRLEKILRYDTTANYMAYLTIIHARPELEKEVGNRIHREIEELKERYRQYLNALQEIRDEASWFPFPSILRQFCSEFNQAAGIISWAFSTNFNDSETFRKALSATENLEFLLRALKERLKFLKLVRDTTLFSFTLGRTFFWIELIGILFCFAGVPLFIYFGSGIGLNWLQALLRNQQWEIQKVLVAIISIVALCIAALRTTVIFERKREKLLTEAREQREKIQEIRLEAIKKRRIAEAEAAALRRRAEENRQLRQKLQE